MDINISDANQFISLHAHPQTVSSNDLSLINAWISKYPYCQSLHFLAAQATKSAEETESYLAKAATFASNREALFQFINHVENFETENVVLDESLNAPNEILEVIEPRNDMGQAFGADLNYYKVDEAKADAEENIEDTLVLEETQLEESVKEIEVIEETVAEENIEEPTAKEEIYREDPVQEIETVEEAVPEEIVEKVTAQKEIHTEEPVQETENIEETVPEEIVEEPATEEEIHTEESVQETENVEETVAEENIEEPIAEEEIHTEEPAQETENIEETVPEEIVEEPATEEEIHTEESVQETENIEETVAEEIVEEPIAEEEIHTEEPVQETETIAENVTQEIVEEPIDDEEIHTEEPIQETENIEETVTEENIEEETVEEETHTEEPVQETENVEEAVAEEIVEKLTEKDELIFESPVASDFFAFAKAEKTDPQPVVSPSAQSEEEKPQTNTKEDISQYNDERLPYTFLWWLNKTRKEYASNTQPYVKANKPATIKKEVPLEQSLNHQIAENIFHLRGADEIGSNNMQNQTVPFDFRRKEFQIIEKFIKEEPQIKPPAANKIDTENKAKKSSEDANQVVSETLAKIYVEQMLYHKALDVYKKLSLKYPEKSTYFASQIKYLELKVN